MSGGINPPYVKHQKCTVGDGVLDVPQCAKYGRGHIIPPFVVIPDISVVILRSKATKDLMVVAKYMPRDEILR